MDWVVQKEWSGVFLQGMEKLSLNVGVKRSQVHQPTCFWKWGGDPVLLKGALFLKGLASHVQATARGKGKWLLRRQSLVSLVQSWRVEASLKIRIQSECGWNWSPAHISSVTGHFCITWFMLKEDYLFQRERKWRRIEEENRPERGELLWGLGGQDNVIVHRVPQDIFTQTAQGRKVKKDKKPSKGGTKVQVRMHWGNAVKGRLTIVYIKCCWAYILADKVWTMLKDVCQQEVRAETQDQNLC